MYWEFRLKQKSNNSIAIRLISGSTARMLLLIGNLAATFVMMPFLVHQLGDRLYGFWSIIGTAVGYFGFFDFGLSSAVSRFVSRAFGKSDQNEANKVISNALFLFAILSIVIIIVSSLTAFLGQNFLSQGDKHVFRDCMLILGITLGISFPVKAFTGTLFAQLNHGLFAISELFGLIVRFSLVMYFISKGGELRTIAIINALAQLVSCLSITYFFFQTQKSFKFYSPNKECISTLFKYSFITFITQIAELIRLRISPMIISSFLSFSSVTLYSIADRLMDYFIQMVVSLLGTLSPYFSRLEGEENNVAIREKFILFSKIATFMAMLAGCGIFIFGKMFIVKWMGVEYVKSFSILQILTVAYCVALTQTTTGQLMYGISKHKFIAGITWGEAILNVCLCLLLVKRFGLFGIAFGIAIPMFIFKGIVQPVFICKIIKMKINKYYISIFFRPVFVAIIFSSFYWFTIHQYLKPDYFNLIYNGILFCSLYIVSVFYFGFDKRSKDTICNQFKFLIDKIIKRDIKTSEAL